MKKLLILKKILIYIKNGNSFSHVFHMTLKIICNDLGYPNFATLAHTKLRKLLKFRSFLKKEKLAKKLSKTYEGPIISKSKGFLLFDESKDLNLSPLIQTCEKILNEKGKNSLKNYHLINNNKKRSKEFFFNIIEEKDVLENPELMEFILSDEIVGCVANYYGFIPQLCSLGLFVSPENKEDNFKQSQLFHLDGENENLKCYFNVSNVTPNSGAFTFIPKDKCNLLRHKNGGKLKSEGVEDKKLLNEYEKKYSIQILGGPGNGGIVDTTSCLHYGSRCTQGERIVFMFHFSTFADYTEIEVNPLRDIRLQHYPQIRKKFADTCIRKEILSVG